MAISEFLQTLTISQLQAISDEIGFDEGFDPSGPNSFDELADWLEAEGEDEGFIEYWQNQFAN